MQTYEIIKPIGTFYTDYVIQDGILYAIFEFDNRVKTVEVCKTQKDRVDEFEENDTHLFLSI